MAVPKRRTSKARKGKRRTHDNLVMPNIPRSQKSRAEGSRSKRFFCSNCNQPKASHTVCPNCGYYRGRPLVEVER
ncbi:MAG: 50S ribosomal protein L32 [Candidatus Brocadiae bacterium]|nr:50S ribosomal protein L32 [Candidatus Brocadiia bacterium]